MRVERPPPSWYTQGGFRPPVHAPTEDSGPPRQARRAMFQRPPTAAVSVFACCWPRLRTWAQAQSTAAQLRRHLRELSVPLVVQEPMLVRGARHTMSGPERHLYAENRHIRALLALQQLPMMVRPLANVSQEVGVRNGVRGSVAGASLAGIQRELDAEGSKSEAAVASAKTTEAEESAAAVVTAVEAARCEWQVSTKKMEEDFRAAREEIARLRNELEEMRRAKTGPADQREAASGQPRRSLADSGAEDKAAVGARHESQEVLSGDEEVANAEFVGDRSLAEHKRETGNDDVGGETCDDLIRDAMGRIVVHDGLERFEEFLFIKLALPLASELAKCIQRERLTLEQAFDAIAGSDGQMSLFDLKSAVVRIGVCDRRDSVERLYEMMLQPRAHRVTQRDWCRVLAAHMPQRSSAADHADPDMSIDIAEDDAEESGESERKVDKTPEERRSRSMRVFSVARALQCSGGSLKDLDFFNEQCSDFPTTDLDAVVREWQLDLSTKDVRELVSYLSSTDASRISRSRWCAAMKAERIAVASLIRALTVVASALLWDVRTVYHAFPGKDPQGASTKLARETISKADLVEMNDSYQFCLSERELDVWFRYLDASHSGRIGLRSWLRALSPFQAAINAMGRPLRRLLGTKACTAVELFAAFDKDKDGKLTLPELETSLQSELAGLDYPQEHVRIFHRHLTYFTEEDDNSVYLSHWQAGFDLIACDFTASSEDKDECQQEDYAVTLERAKLASATEQLAALVLRPATGRVLPILIEMGRHRTGIIGEPDALKAVGLDVPLLELQWRMLREHGDMTPQVDVEKSREAVMTDIMQGVSGLREKYATRGALLLAVLLASHKLSIEAAFAAFSGDNAISFRFNRFREIMRRLAPDFGAASPRIEALFLSLTDPTENESSDLRVCKEQWNTVLRQAASRLSNQQHVSILLQKGASASDSGSGSAERQSAEPDALAGGERARLRDVFFASKELERSPDDKKDTSTDQSQLLQKNRLFINEHQLKLSLAKMGVRVPARTLIVTVCMSTFGLTSPACKMPLPCLRGLNNLSHLVPAFSSLIPSPTIRFLRRSRPCLNRGRVKRRRPTQRERGVSSVAGAGEANRKTMRMRKSEIYGGQLRSGSLSERWNEAASRAPSSSSSCTASSATPCATKCSRRRASARRWPCTNCSQRTSCRLCCRWGKTGSVSCFRACTR